MTLSDFRRITDEMLSAYIDGEITEQERALIEAAIAQDGEIAWRLNSLRQTVSLLRELPELALPRSFTLTLDQVQTAQSGEQMARAGATAQQPMATPAAPPPIRRETAPQNIAGFWERVNEGWRNFWQGGNPMLRNAAAVSFALMLVLAGGGPLLNRALTQPVSMMATAPEAPAPQAEGAAAPAAEVVAIAPTATVATASDTAMMQVQEDSANKAAGEETPAEESVADSTMMQSEALPPSEGEDEATDEAQAESSEAARAVSPESEAAEDEVAESADAESETAEAAMAAAVETPAEESAAQDAPAEEAAVAAMAAPEGEAPVEPPLTEIPFPGGGAGEVARSQSGGGMGGGEPEGPAGMGGGEAVPGELAPPQAYTFDVSPEDEAVVASAGEEVTVGVAAASVAESSTASVAEVAVTPAVEVALPEVAAASAMTEAPAESSDVAAAGEEVVSEAEIEATATPTAEAVAVIAPEEEITSSEVVENVSSEGAVAATGPAANLPVVWVAQGSLLLVTILLASLWWRSRTPHRPR